MNSQNENFGMILPDGIFSSTGDLPDDNSIDWNINDMLENYREFTAIFTGKPLKDISLESVLEYKISDYQAYLSACEVQDCEPVDFKQFVLGAQLFNENENLN